MLTALQCLALTIYFEAGGEPIPGKWAVGQVVLNRVESTRWPNDICSVVTQRNQFTWYWDGRSDKPKDGKAWKDSQKVAKILIRKLQDNEKIYDFSEGANHYYNPNKVKPYWSNDGELTVVIANHIFRRL